MSFQVDHELVPKPQDRRQWGAVSLRQEKPERRVGNSRRRSCAMTPFHCSNSSTVDIIQPSEDQSDGVIVPRKSPLPTVSAWQVEFVRLIGFPANPAVLLDQNWWVGVAGSKPDDFVSIRSKELRDDRGTFEGALLSVTVDFNRVIWEARPPAVVDQSGIFPTFDGPFREKLDWFTALLDPWLTATCPPLLRLAFSAKLLQPAATTQGAYRVLATHLPGVSFDPPPNDFLLQLNRRKEKSAVVESVPINRVSTWSRMNIAVWREPGKPFKWPDRCYSALELDINTAPESFESLPKAALPRLFKELASLGVEIAERGDRP